MGASVAVEAVPTYLAGEWARAGRPLEVRNPANDELLATTWQAGRAELERATEAAVEAAAPMRRLTRSLEHALLAHEELEVGGVIVNDVPTSRIGPMPYGGLKESGLGRQGLRSAIAETTEPRLLAIARQPR